MDVLHLGERRASLPRFVADLIRTKSSFNDPDLYERLLHKEYGTWMGGNTFSPDYSIGSKRPASPSPLTRAGPSKSWISSRSSDA